MQDIRKLARSAGILYGLDAVIASGAFVFDPSRIVDAHSMAGAAAHIHAAQSMIRLDMLTEASYQTIEVFLSIQLYRLFRPVSAALAWQMLVLALVPIPMVLLNLLNEVGALLFASDGFIAGAFAPPQRDAIAGLLIRMHGQGLQVAAIFWGLWLIPLGLLIMRCGFFPRLLGVCSIAGGLGYLLGSGASLILPGLVPPALVAICSSAAFFLELGEVPFILWLIIRGARELRPAQGMA